ncbi:hypothetical protein FGB62_50g05 [Gracilaria domingensis]|nr:hypothetical protein FGB62_50g05 [Gracilaria domingensis]
MEPLSEKTDDAPPDIDLYDELSLNELFTLDIPPLPEPSPQPYEVTEKQLRPALVGGCKCMPRACHARPHAHARTRGARSAADGAGHSARVWAVRQRKAARANGGAGASDGGGDDEEVWCAAMGAGAPV